MTWHISYYFTRDHFIIFIKFVIQENYIQFVTQLYHQIYGFPQRDPLTDVLANTYLQFYELNLDSKKSYISVVYMIWLFLKLIPTINLLRTFMQITLIILKFWC